MKRNIRLTESDLTRIVKRVIMEHNNKNFPESKFNDTLTKLLKSQGIKVSYQYFSHNMYKLTGTVYLYKNGEVLGYRHGYNFSYDFDQRFGRLTYLSHFPNIENVDMLRFLPPENVIEYFSDNLVSHIKKDNPYLFK